MLFAWHKFGAMLSIRYFFLLKGPAADATDAPQPWGWLCNPVMKVRVYFCISILMKHRLNEIDWGKQKYSKKNLSQCHSFRHKSHIDRPGNFFSVPFFFPLIHFVSLAPSLLLHVTYVPCYCPYTTNATQTSMPPAGFEPTIPASERPQTHALDRGATGIGRDRTRVFAVRGRRLTAWAMARPYVILRCCVGCRWCLLYSLLIWLWTVNLKGEGKQSCLSLRGNKEKVWRKARHVTDWWLYPCQGTNRGFTECKTGLLMLNLLTCSSWWVACRCVF